MGSIVVQAGDSPISIATKAWGSAYARNFLEIVAANGGRIMFHPGETINVPDKPSTNNPYISEASITALRNAGMWGPAAGAATPAAGAPPRQTSTLTSADGANSSYRPSSNANATPLPGGGGAAPVLPGPALPNVPPGQPFTPAQWSQRNGAVPNTPSTPAGAGAAPSTVYLPQVQNRQAAPTPPPPPAMSAEDMTRFNNWLHNLGSLNGQRSPEEIQLDNLHSMGIMTDDPYFTQRMWAGYKP